MHALLDSGVPGRTRQNRTGRYVDKAVPYGHSGSEEFEVEDNQEMSGGHWDYQGFKVKDILERIGADPEVTRRFPKLASLLPELGEILCDMEYDLDWDLSNDRAIDSDPAFQAEVLRKLA